MKRLIKPQALMAGAFALTLLFGGCSTTETRIAERPEVYNSLPERDKALVMQGQIRAGMTQDAVYLAWGAPSQRGFGTGGGRPIETWIYNNTTSGNYYPPYFGFGYGGYGRGYFGGGGFGRGGRGFYGRGFYPFYDPFYYRGSQIISYPDRVVSFRNGRVIAFNFLPAPRIF